MPYIHSVRLEHITEQREAVPGGADKSPKVECRSSTAEAVREISGQYIPLALGFSSLKFKNCQCKSINVTVASSVVVGYRCSLHLKPRYPILYLYF